MILSMVPSTKAKILNALLILTSLVGYLEWGADNRSFLFQAEGEIFVKLLNDPESVMHPFTLLPLSGQILLLITLFQKTPGKIITCIALACIGLLLAFMFVISLISWNVKILISTLPFLITAFLAILHHSRSQSST